MRILLTCGIGDFVAIESYVTPEERAAVTAVHWATRARESLMSLIPFVLPNVQEHVVERDTWGAPFTDDFCISSRGQLPELDPAVVDWSVRTFVPEIITGARQYSGSTLVNATLCDIGRLNLPRRYIAVHPFSENARALERDMTAAEWMATQRYASRLDVPLVIINKGGGRMLDQFGNCVDLSDQLTLAEAIEVTKRASAFVGCASIFSVIAAKTLDHESLFIKTNWSARRHYFWLYYAPQWTNSFVAESLLDILPHA